jgi:hypothetical protein
MHRLERDYTVIHEIKTIKNIFNDDIHLINV